jgi:hypothetical protein
LIVISFSSALNSVSAVTSSAFFCLAGTDSAGGGVRHASGGHLGRGLWVVYAANRLGLGAPGVGYSLVWFFVNDRIKLVAYRIFDPCSQ